MSDSSPDLLTRAVGYLVGFVGLGGLLGYLQYRLAARRAPADVTLIAAQAEVQQATAEEIRAKVRREDENAIVTNLRAVTQELRSEVERLSGDRDYWKNDSAYWKARCEKAERAPLEEELKRLPGNGKGN